MPIGVRGVAHTGATMCVHGQGTMCTQVQGYAHTSA